MHHGQSGFGQSPSIYVYTAIHVNSWFKLTTACQQARAQSLQHRSAATQIQTVDHNPFKASYDICLDPPRDPPGASPTRQPCAISARIDTIVVRGAVRHKCAGHEGWHPSPCRGVGHSLRQPHDTFKVLWSTVWIWVAALRCCRLRARACWQGLSSA